MHVRPTTATACWARIGQVGPGHWRCSACDCTWWATGNSTWTSITLVWWNGPVSIELVPRRPRLPLVLAQVTDWTAEERRLASTFTPVPAAQVLPTDLPTIPTRPRSGFDCSMTNGFRPMENFLPHCHRVEHAFTDQKRLPLAWEPTRAPCLCLTSPRSSAILGWRG